MSSFTEPLIVEVTQRDKRPFKVVKKFSYEIGEKGSGNVVQVNAGFYTDGATIPRPLNALIPAWGRHGKAAVLHDWLYRNSNLPKEHCDAIFKEAMEVLGVPRYRAKILYWAVKIFGWIPYKRIRNKRRKWNKEKEER